MPGKSRLTPVSPYTNEFHDQDSFLQQYDSFNISMLNHGKGLQKIKKTLQDTVNALESGHSINSASNNYNFPTNVEKRLFKQHLKHTLYFVHQYKWWSNAALRSPFAASDVINSDAFADIMTEIFNQDVVLPLFNLNYELVASAIITVPESSYPGRGVWRPTNKIQHKYNGEYGVGNLVILNKPSNELELWNPDAWMGVGHVSNTLRYTYAAQYGSKLCTVVSKDRYTYFDKDTIAMNNLIRNAVFDKEFMQALLSPRINRKQNYRESEHSIPSGDKSEIDIMLSPREFELYVKDDYDSYRKKILNSKRNNKTL